jgi:hypothetical protein
MKPHILVTSTWLLSIETANNQKLCQVFHVSHNTDDLNPRPRLEQRTVRSYIVFTVFLIIHRTPIFSDLHGTAVN